MDIPHIHSKPIRLLYFWIGIIATIAYRIIMFLNDVSPQYVNVVWYIGTIGFIIYFIHRYQISEARATLITEHQLDQKVMSAPGLSPADKEAMVYVFKTLENSKEKLNYIVIFVSSAVALLVGVYVDFLR